MVNDLQSSNAVMISLPHIRAYGLRLQGEFTGTSLAKTDVRVADALTIPKE